MIERGAQNLLQFPRIFNVSTENAACISQLRKIRVLKIRTEADDSRSLHLEFHETQGIILIDDDFTGAFSCRSVSNSPISMESPPSPDMEITWRSGNAT